MSECCGFKVNKLLPRELFNTTFASCWAELYEPYQDALVSALEEALLGHNVPADILQCILGLAEFMEHDDRPIPIDIAQLGQVAETCHMYAKALHYKETQFMATPGAALVEPLISINTQLQQHEAALGILVFGQQNLDVKLKTAWYEKLQRWPEALQAYETCSDPNSDHALLGRITCLQVCVC